MRVVPWLIIVVAACALPSADEFARGPASIPDAGDGGSTSISEAGTVLVDGGTDASIDAPAGFCPRTAVYCNDFSAGAPADIGRADVTPGASLTIANGVLEAKFPAYPDPGYYDTHAIYELPPASTKVTIEVDLNVSVASWTGGNMIVLGAYYNGQPNNHAMEMYVGPDYMNITTTENGGNLLYDQPSKDLPRGQWVRVKLEADFTANKGTLRLSFDNTVVAEHAGFFAFTPSSDVSFRALIGMTRNNPPTPALTTLYDNLVITLP